MAKEQSSSDRWRCFADRKDGTGAVAVNRSEVPDLLEAGARLWVDVLAPTPADTDWLKRTFKFHPLALSDVLNDNVRPKNETYGPVMFTVFRALNLNTEADPLDTINLNLFLTDRHLVTTHSAPLRSVREVIERIDRDKTTIESGTSFLYYRLLDGVVDRYLDLADHLDDRIDELEDLLFNVGDGAVQQVIFELKKQVSVLRHRVLPERDVLASLVRGDFPQIDAQTQMHLRDVLDHAVRTRDILEAQRDLLNGLMEAYMTHLSNRMNEVMKLLSIIATLMLPLGVIAGIFGMNFDAMPMLRWKYGFWVLIGMMADGLARRIARHGPAWPSSTPASAGGDPPSVDRES